MHHGCVLPTAKPYANLLTALLVRSCDYYLETQAEQAQQLMLKEFIDTMLKESATAPVAMELDQITANSPQQLAAFVTNQVNKTTEKLRHQVSQLQNSSQLKKSNQP
jgi:hypothetical protein